MFSVTPNAPMLRTEVPGDVLSMDELNIEIKYTEGKNTKQAGRIPYRIFF